VSDSPRVPRTTPSGRTTATIGPERLRHRRAYATERPRQVSPTCSLARQNLDMADHSSNTPVDIDFQVNNHCGTLASWQPVRSAVPESGDWCMLAREQSEWPHAGRVSTHPRIVRIRRTRRLAADTRPSRPISAYRGDSTAFIGQPGQRNQSEHLDAPALSLSRNPMRPTQHYSRDNALPPIANEPWPRVTPGLSVGVKGGYSTEPLSPPVKDRSSAKDTRRSHQLNVIQQDRGEP
jgi:hypothetical protein